MCENTITSDPFYSLNLFCGTSGRQLFYDDHWNANFESITWICITLKKTTSAMSVFRSQIWIDLMNDLRDRHLFSGSREHTCLVRFVFLGVLQRDLDECREKWNTHAIRPVNQSRCPSGKPDVMYNLPHRLLFFQNRFFLFNHIFF